MGTRGAIGHTTPEGWQAVYSHNDSYPAGVGKALWDACHDDYYGDLARMAREVVDEHPGGWVSFAHRECFCHDRGSGEAMLVTDKDDPGLLWFAYVLDTCQHQLRILHRKADLVYDAAGGVQAANNTRWEPYATVDLRGPEPDWDTLGKSEESE